MLLIVRENLYRATWHLLATLHCRQAKSHNRILSFVNCSTVHKDSTEHPRTHREAIRATLMVARREQRKDEQIKRIVTFKNV